MSLMNRVRTQPAPSSIVRETIVGPASTLLGVADRFGQDAVHLAGLNGTADHHHAQPLGLQSSVSMNLLAAPIPPFVAMTSPLPPGTPYPYGTGWLGAVSIVQGQYAGQPLSTNL